MTEAIDSRSPHGTYAISVSSWEARMSLWIDTPTIVLVATSEPVLALNDRHWSLDAAAWLDDNTVQLTLRKYPGNRDPSQLTVVVDCGARTARVEDADVVSLDALEFEMDRVLRARPYVSQGILPG